MTAVKLVKQAEFSWTYPLLDGDNRQGVLVLAFESCLVNNRPPALLVEVIESPRSRGAFGEEPPYPPKLCDLDTQGRSSERPSIDCEDEKEKVLFNTSSRTHTVRTTDCTFNKRLFCSLGRPLMGSAFSAESHCHCSSDPPSWKVK